MILGPFMASGGLSTSPSVLTVPPNMATVLTDAYTFQNGLTNFGSTTKLNASALNSGKRIVGLGAYFDPARAKLFDNTAPVIVAVVQDAAAGKIYTGPYTSTSITFTDRTGAVSLPPDPNAAYTFDSLNGILVIAGGSENATVPFQLATYNGNVANLAGSPPYANCVKVVNNFCFLGGQYNAASTFSTLNWSAVGDPQTWPAGNSLTFRNNDDDMITALAALGQSLMIFKRRSIGLLSTTSQVVSGAVTLGPLSTITTSYGCVAPNAAKELPDGRVAFLDSRFHLIITDGYSFFDVTDQPYPGPNLRTTFDSYAGTYSPFLLPISLAVLPQKNQIWVLFESSVIYTYDYMNNAWASSTLSGGADDAFVILDCGQTNANETVATHLLVGTNGGFVWELNGTGGPSDLGGSNITPNMTLSGQLPMDFVPRTLMIPATLQSGASLTVTVGFNGTLNSSASTLISTSNAKLWNLFDIRSTQTNIPRPLSMQVQIQVTAGKTFTIYPIYVTDEILSNVS